MGSGTKKRGTVGKASKQKILVWTKAANMGGIWKVEWAGSDNHEGWRARGTNNDTSVLTVGGSGWWSRFQRRGRLENKQIWGGERGGGRWWVLLACVKFKMSLKLSSGETRTATGYVSGKVRIEIYNSESGQCENGYRTEGSDLNHLEASFSNLSHLNTIFNNCFSRICL